MTALSSPTYVAPQRGNWFQRAEAWLDDKGKGAWIAAMVLGFVFFWPVGLALVLYMTWSKKMFGTSCRKSGNSFVPTRMRSTGNSAFDAYREETLRRLEEEQGNFEAFLERLREAKDKAELDEFMEERAKAARAED